MAAPSAWNLVEGVNDPAENSERAIWIDGDAAASRRRSASAAWTASISPTGRRLTFASESAHARDENFLVIRSRYRHRFGSFSGSLGGVPLAEGLGVMEQHDAVW